MQQTQGQAADTRRLRLLSGTLIGGILLSVLLEMVVQLLPPHYNPIRQSESDLAVGHYGYLMALNFLLRGVLYLLFIVAYRQVVPRASQSRGGLTLLGISAIGKIILAFAATDLTARPTTFHGAIHAVAALGSFICGALGILLLTFSLRHIPNVGPAPHVLVRLADVTLAWSVLVVGTVTIAAKIGVWGLFERILTALIFVWIVIVARSLWLYPAVHGMAAQMQVHYHPRELLNRRKRASRRQLLHLRSAGQ